MFNLHNFVLRTLSIMRNRLDEYQVRAYALTWYGKSVLTDEDMLTIDSWYTIETEETVTTNEDTESPNSDFEDVTTDKKN